MTNTISSTKCPSTLTSGKYGMSQHLSIIDNSKEYIFVKLTDSALRSIEEYQCALQARRLAHGQRARIQFIGNGGIIHFPTADNNNDGINGGNLSDGRKFGFAIDDVEGSLECVQQSGANLDVLGSLNCRMRIHANDDIYDTTRTKMAIAEETEKSKCIREIKPNQTDIGRKVKRPLSTTSAQVYATNSGVGSSNSCVSISGGNGNGNGSNLSNSKISRNKLSSLNNYSPQSQSINGSNTNSGSALLHSSSTSSRVLKMSSNAHMSPNSTIMGNSDSTIDNISNRCYGGSSNSSVYTGQSHNPSLSAASTLSSTLAGGVTTGYQSALSNGNYQSSMLDLVGYPSNCKVLGGSGNNNNNNNNSGRNSNNSLCRGGKGQGRGNSSLFGGNNKLLDVSRRKLRERLIHLLALKPFKKPELFARLQNEGLSKRDRNNITNLLNDISTLMRDNTYNLKHNLWNNVDENWQYFTEQERQQLKRRKPQNLTPPNSSDAGSTTSGQSPTSHTGSPPPQTSGHGMLKRVRMESGDLYEGPLSSSGGGIQPKKQRISHYKKNALETKIFSSNTANTTTNSPGIRKLGSAGCYSSNNNSNSTYNVFQQSRNSSPYSPQNYNSNSNNTTSSNSNNNASIGNLLHIDDDHLSFKFSSSITENNSSSGASSKKTRNSSGTTSNNTSNKATMKKEKTSFAVQDGLTSRRNNNNKNNNTLSMPYTQNFMLGSQDRHNDDKTSSSNAISNNNSSGNCGSNRALHSQQQQKTPTLSNHITYGHNNNNKHNSNNANCSNADVEVVTSVNRQYNNNCINNNNNNNNKNNTGSSSRHHHSSTISDSRKHSRSSTPSQNQLTQKRNRNNNNNNNNNNSSVNSTMSNKRYHQNNSTNNTKNNCQFGTSLALPVMPPSHHLLSSNIDVSDCTSDVEQPYKLQTQEYNQHKQLKQHEPESSAQIKRKQSLPTEQEIADVANSFSIDTQGSELMPYDFSNYTTITTVEQRRRYRTDFESEYDEYLELSEKIGKVQTRFRDMGERMASLQPDCRDYHKIKNQIIQEYENLRKEQESINKNNERLNYLGAKLGYIKQLVAEFDKKVKAGEIRITPPPQQIAEEKHRHHQHHNNNTMQNVNQNRNHYQHTHPLTQVMNVPIVTAPAATATFTSTLTTVNDLNLSPMLQTDIKDENDCCSTLSPSSSLVSNSYENARHLKYQDLQSQQRQQQQQNQHQQQQQRYHHYRTHNNHYKQKQHYQQHHVPETIGAIEKNHQSQLQIKENGIDNSNNSVNSNHNKDGVVNGNKCSNYQLNEMYQTQLHHRNHHKQQQHQQQGQQQPQAQQHSPSPLQNYSNSESDSDNDSSSSSSSSDGSDDDDDDGEDEAEAGKVGENHDNVGDDENDDDDDDDDNSHDEGNNSNIDNSNDDCDDDSYHHHNNPTY